MTRTGPEMNAALALTRFGLGARPGEIGSVGRDATGWLLGQIRPEGAAPWRGDFVGGAERMAQINAYRRQIEPQTNGEPRRPAQAAQPAQTAQPAMNAPMQDGRREGDPAAFDAAVASRRVIGQDVGREFLARAQLGASTPDGFAERWALFWANAFTVSATKFVAGAQSGPYEREAIRPNVFGRFADLAVAAERHPAMLLYLDQAQSIGPNSRAGQRRNAGLNENLAREILELHTVGADGGYTQADVTEFARALTGWSVAAPRDGMGGGMGAQGGGRRGQAMRAALQGEPGPNGFVWRTILHEPGARTVMGRTYRDGRAEQGEAILRDLAARPQTARRLARKIAAHFVADDPPPALVARLEAAWTRTDGDLAEMARALVTAPEAWEPAPLKVKTPYEFVISTHRALASNPARIQPLQQALLAMGQPMWAPPSPEGWPDTAADWAGPDAMVKRLTWAQAVAERAQGAAGFDPNAVADAALAARLGDRSRMAIRRAESRTEALILLLMSPEFQRR